MEKAFRPLENLLPRLLKDGYLPKRLAAYANAVRELGNFGTHAFGEAVTKPDVAQSLTQLTLILEWYFEHELPAATARRAKPAVRAAPLRAAPTKAPPTGPAAAGPHAGSSGSSASSSFWRRSARRPTSSEPICAWGTSGTGGSITAASKSARKGTAIG